MGDSLTLRGRNVYVEDLDAKVAAATGLSRERLAVVSTFGSGRPGAAVFAEAKPGGWVDDTVRLLRAELGPEPALTIVVGRAGLVQRTSSGKPRRRRMWQQLQEGLPEGATVVTDLPALPARNVGDDGSPDGTGRRTADGGDEPAEVPSG